MLAACLLMAGLATAQEQEKEEPSMGGHEEMMKGEEMAPMGPPEEIKALGFMVGDWKSHMKFRMTQESEEWMETTTDVACSWIAGGAALRAEYTGEMMGEPFNGVAITAYDRELGQYQDIWVDNMAARVSMYHGQMKGDKYVSEGEDIWMGQKMLSRMTISDMTDTSYTWTMEHSFDNGETWQVMGMSTNMKQ
jgi:hypothetical protein